MGQKQSAQEILEHLVGFATVSEDSNLKLVDFVEQYLSSWGVNSVRVPNEDGIKAALYAHIGPDIPGGVVLSGHTDVVPVAGQDWDSDPFVLTQKNNRLYGRGSCDMKGFVALALAAVPLAVAQHKAQNLTRPLQIALSYDEEVGCTGAPVMIDHMLANGMPQASTVIVGEPTNMQVVTGHKAGIGFQVHVQGFEVHSSLLPEGVSAILEGARLINWANAQNERLQATPPTPLAAAFYPPFTTLHVGKIQGGTAHNITAKDCYFDLSFRVVPDETPAEWEAKLRAEVKTLKAKMKAIHPDAAITLTQGFGVPGLRPEENGLAEQLARQLTGDNASHVVSYATEAGQFQERGYSVVVCGPGDIAQAHQPNEFLEISQLRAGETFMENLIKNLSV
ncbi:acetylornithine deacetylase [Aestuariibius sp. HNIBRBA575]|uniref:acetylornithine deacetylase n=1 Tax=Aestuariibius sp. HNIBRBA575 TaxID=3233343 RepID=UPI0034A4A0BF